MRHLAAKAEAARKLKEKKRLAALKKKKKKRGFGASMASTSSSTPPAATMSMTKKPSTISSGSATKGTPAKAESNAAGGVPQVTVDSTQQIVNIDFKTSAETSKDNLDDSGNEDEEGGDSPKFGG